MKRICFSLMAGLVCFASFSQSGHGTFEASITGADRITLVKTSMNLPSWHEKSFWPAYELYMKTMEQASSRTHHSLYDLANLDHKNSDGEAFEHAKKLLAFREEELTILKKYYADIAREFNGVIALQFVQTETLLDMMETAGMYDKTQWKNFRFNPKSVTGPKFEQAKHNTIKKALALTPEQEFTFFQIYNAFEDECYAYLGDNYDLVGIYASEPSDFTPAIAKRLGYNLITVSERDLKLKTKYFEEFNERLGASVAARFLAWEDYYSVVSKMQHWVSE